ncbi:hypothetical protein D4T97_007060 [Siminovitchia acidinfaciens]|uniref:Uncharacterized protein n=1 Tax=Siminovitchia acidinfaciens TaxID=2321395 RepID=A0A429Y500_9BACI|nr:hypothetical protein [Siminovitchia acidinfaciens]RST76512.1 hypothetical protein D4T97_007060 [Siminovitchia acidinfaciens]
MSDVMKQVVQEVLQGNKTIISSKVDRRDRPSGNVALNDIKRPNYQKLKQEQRLSGLKKPGASIAGHKKPRGQSPLNTLSDKHFNEDSISRLRSISLAQGKVSRKSGVPRQGDQRENKSAKIVGHTRNGGCVWFFPNLPQELMGSFHRPLNRAAVGAVRMPECLPSYLFLVNEIIRDNQDIKFYISWERDGDGPFIAEFYDDDVDRLERVMNEIYQKLNRRSLKHFETFTAISPSPWLTKQLNISLSVDAIAILEGVPYYTSIVLMDSLLKNFENTGLDYEIAEKYLLLKGNYHVISELVTELKKEAGRLTSADKMTI